MKTSIRSLSILTFAIIGFAFLPGAQAVVPPPDGGYPGGNTAEGLNALFSLTTGQHNTAVGLNSLSNTTTSSNNTAIGAGVLRFNTGENNTATGEGALRYNTSGSSNVAYGVGALENNTTGVANTAVGPQALGKNIQGSVNTAVGLAALTSNLTGGSNTAVGEEALSDNTTGSANTANGAGALRFNTTGGNNTAIGLSALDSNTTGRLNTAVGMSAGHGVTGGNGNTAIGAGAGAYQTNGNRNVYIGVGALGTLGTSESDACYIASIFGQTSPSGVPVVINSHNKLGTVTSSKRFKEKINPMDRASEALFSLKPVTFQYKSHLDPKGTPQFGLVAEDVEKVNPDLVVRDKEGKPYTVRYEAVNAMLLNEFLKEHRKVEEQQATITELKSAVAQQQKDFQTMAAHLTKRLDEQASEIQKVSAQLEMSKPAAKVAKND